MKLLHRFSLLHQQYKAPFIKNLILAWRSKKSTFLQLSSSLFFIFLIFCIQEAFEGRFSDITAFENVADPKPFFASSIPPCAKKFYIKSECYGFIWGGNGSAKVTGIVDSIRANTPSRPIPKEKLVTAFGFPYTSSFSDTYRFIWSLFPPNLLAQALKLLADATSTPQDIGISWSGRSECAPNDDECLITINDIYLWLVSTFFVWCILAIYFDNIIPNSSGVRKSVFYFLKPGYWTGRGGNKVEEGGICSCVGSVPRLNQISQDDEDVLQEQNLVKHQSREGTVDENIAGQIRGLTKTYPGSRNGGCCSCKKNPPYHALKDLWVNFP